MGAQYFPLFRLDLEFLIPMWQRQKLEQALIASRCIREWIGRDVKLAFAVGSAQRRKRVIMPEEIGAAIDDKGNFLARLARGDCRPRRARPERRTSDRQPLRRKRSRRSISSRRNLPLRSASAVSRIKNSPLGSVVKNALASRAINEMSRSSNPGTDAGRLQRCAVAKNRKPHRKRG